MAEKIRVHPDCVNASNPYHECVEYCFQKISGSSTIGSSQRLGRRNRLGFLPKTLQVADKEQHSGKIHSRDSSLGERQVRSSQSLPKSEIFTVPNSPKDNPSKDSIKNIVNDEDKGASLGNRQVRSFQSFPATGNVKEIHPLSSYNKGQGQSSQSSQSSSISEIFRMPHSPSRKDYPSEGSVKNIVNDAEEGAVIQARRSITSSDSDIDNSSEKSDEVAAHSLTSDSHVSVVKYHVKPTFSPILQSIFDKHGDIAAKCQLESVAMRTYYLECVCSVVKELQSALLAQMTMSRIKEMLAILKDIESSKIDVSWLRFTLNEITEVLEFVKKHDTIKAAKVECENDLESTRKELEAQMEDLAIKEKEAADAKARVDETSRRLDELKLKSSELNLTVSSAAARAAKYLGKSLAGGIFVEQKSCKEGINGE